MGIPAENLYFFVLCLKTFIPEYMPRLPKAKAHKKRKFSEMRVFLFSASFLSINITKKENKFIHNK